MMLTTAYAAALLAELEAQGVVDRSARTADVLRALADSNLTLHPHDHEAASAFGELVTGVRTS